MDYLLLIVEPRGQRAERTRAEGEAAYAQMLAFADRLKARGVLRGYSALEADDSAQRVQLREGQPRLLDGPFTESKEMVGGFFWVDCASREEAATLAATCPAAAWATVEVRPMGPCYL